MDDPDFKAFAKAWVEGDKRLSALVHNNPDAAEELIARLARAMEKRRRQVQSEVDSGGDLVLNVDPEQMPVDAILKAILEHKPE